MPICRNAWIIFIKKELCLAEMFQTGIFYIVPIVGLGRNRLVWRSPEFSDAVVAVSLSRAV